ncbi:ATP-binding domain-containing protein [Bacillus licheniformis]|uniref:ATP-binding domain-containing protein n=1 Tax=Bacillus TaxID=1386 RepID=UPI001ED9452B|nr:MULTISPECIES: ATP-binding domain-containing protein [Bacillus]
MQPHEHKIYNSFDYGYVITCHKSQGSQWEKVVVIDEVLDRNMHHRWLYTAITRSTEKLVLVV